MEVLVSEVLTALVGGHLPAFLVKHKHLDLAASHHYYLHCLLQQTPLALSETDLSQDGQLNLLTFRYLSSLMYCALMRVLGVDMNRLC